MRSVTLIAEFLGQIGDERRRALGHARGVLGRHHREGELRIFRSSSPARERGCGEGQRGCAGQNRTTS